MACRLEQECECKHGFARNSENQCVLLSECSSAADVEDSICPENEKWKSCGGCEGTCDNPNPMCQAVCQPAGCHCPIPYVRGPKGSCIHKDLCKKDEIARNVTLPDSEF